LPRKVWLGWLTAGKPGIDFCIASPASCGRGLTTRKRSRGHSEMGSRDHGMVEFGVQIPMAPLQNPLMSRGFFIAPGMAPRTRQPSASAVRAAAEGALTVAPTRGCQLQQFFILAPPHPPTQFAIGNPVKRTQKMPAKAAAMARQGMERGWVLLGFWRSLIGLRSRNRAFARLGPPWPALAVGGDRIGGRRSSVCGG
jgi:hypothetical protein